MKRVIVFGLLALLVTGLLLLGISESSFAKSGAGDLSLFDERGRENVR